MSIVKDCYWFIDKDTPEDKQKMEAMCVECYKKHNFDFGWYWPGSERGYGDYDLVCAIEGCDNIIHERENKEDASSV